jgi:hypothetical protein
MEIFSDYLVKYRRRPCETPHGNRMNFAKEKKALFHGGARKAAIERVFRE